jgi:hypothetical protein
MRWMRAARETNALLSAFALSFDATARSLGEAFGVGGSAYGEVVWSWRRDAGVKFSGS